MLNKHTQAPELLAALEALLIEKDEEFADDGFDSLEEGRDAWTRFADCDPSGNWRHAKQLIAKAKGGE